MRCFSRTLPSAFVLLLLVTPSAVRSGRHFEEGGDDEHFETEMSIEPVTTFIVGTVSLAGSLYSLYKTNRLLKLDTEQKEAAKAFVSTYKEQQQTGCRMLDQTAVLMDSKRQGLSRLAQDDLHGTQSLKGACADGEGMKRFEASLREQLRGACSSLDIVGGSAKLGAVRDRCEQGAEMQGSLAEKICAMNEDGLAKALKRTDLSLLRLDGVMAGLCDGLPGFQRTLQGSKGKSESRSSFMDLRGTKNSAIRRVTTSVNPLVVLDLVAFGYSILGTMDFGLDLYDTAVTRNDGYTILRDVVKQDVSRQQQLLWSSFQVYWLDVAWMRSVQLATLAERYQSASLSLPPHLSEIQNVNSPQRWHEYGAEEGSYWVCHERFGCLVPASSGSSRGSDQNATCTTSFGDLRMCKSLRSSGVFALAPRRCFSVFYGGKTGASSNIGLEGDAWIFQFARNDHVDVGGGEVYSEEDCLEPLHSLAKSNDAESSLRGNLIGVSEQATDGSSTTPTLARSMHKARQA